MPGHADDVTGANQQLGIDLGVSRVLTQSSQEESREISKHTQEYGTGLKATGTAV